MSYPPQLDYFCQRLEGLSVGLFRLEPQGSSTVTSGQIVRFTAPSNALCDIRSACLRFNATTAGGTPGGVQVRLPNKIESLISKVEVSIGGVQISSGTNFYNTLVHAKACLDGHVNDAGKNHPSLQQTAAANNYVDGTVIDGNEASAINAPYSIDKWCGFLGECEPRVLDLGLVGDLVIQLTIEQPNNCLTVSDGITDASFNICAAANPAASFTLSNLYMTVRCYSLPSGLYDNLLAEQMASAGSLEVGFRQYFGFRDTTASTMRFQVASQSINRIFVAHHRNANPAGTTRAPHLVAGYLAEGATARVSPLNLGSLKHVHQYSSFSQPTGANAEYDFTINGAKFPQYKMSSEDVLQINRLSGDKGDVLMPNVGLVEFKDNEYVAALKLTMDTPNSRFIQGLDSRSVAISGFYNMYGVTADKVLTLFVECGSSLLISSGRQIAVVI
jgi:hypothetical protein